MKKRLMSVLICVLLLVMVIPGVANAAGNGGPYSAYTAVRNAPYSDAQFDKLVKMVDRANDQIIKAVEKAQRTPYDDVDELLATVDAIVANVMDYANSIGGLVVCEYTTYYVDGQYVLIDPLRIIPL